MPETRGSMSIAHNQNLVRRAVSDIFNAGLLSVANDLFARDYVNHGGLIPDLASGPEAIKVSASVYRRAFPYLRITIDKLENDGVTVVMNWTARNRRRGALPEMALDRSAPDRLTGVTRVRCSDGMIVESWTDWDGDVMQHVKGVASVS
jgi:hypothetical protein